MKDIKNLIMSKNLVLIGETHGSKEIPELLLKVLKDVNKKTKFVVCLEIPKEFQGNPKKYYRSSLEGKFGDGRASAEYFNFITELEKENIKIIFIDDYVKTQQEKENNLANNVIKVLRKGVKTIVVLGEAHAYKKPHTFIGRVIYPTGFILNKITKNMISIRIVAKKGNVFNHGIKPIAFDEKDPTNNGFDFIHILKSFSPCTFLMPSKE